MNPSMHPPIYHLTSSERGPIALPQELWQTLDPPKQLFIQGSSRALSMLDQLPHRGIAFVGTRTPQLRSILFVRKIIENLKHSNLIVVSGFARGIDAASHEAALDSGLGTVAILGAGLSVSYPRENEPLRQRILNHHGLIVSEFPPETPPRGFHFLRRNRLISGWTRATCVIEAGARSGALNTARWARDQNKVCFALPCYPGDPALKGNQILLDRDHALAIWDTHSLGAVWLELATHPESRNAKQLELQSQLHLQSHDKCPHLLSLIQQVQHCTFQQGGIHPQDLFDWGMHQGWTPQQFFTTLEGAVREKKLMSQPGIIVSL